ncbi:MAG TPA: DUF6600 domain-containing protein [Candidatus Angelobacter sp.]|nr:DUF6600 domain-containing protein [Candidatus Angelobacter sp.]
MEKESGELVTQGSQVIVEGAGDRVNGNSGSRNEWSGNKKAETPAGLEALGPKPFEIKPFELKLFGLTTLRVALIALLALGLTGLAKAGDGGDYGNSSNGPAPDVARVSLIHGDVSMQRGDTGDWTSATLNTPLVRGDQVATGDKSRAEIELNYANILRLSSSSQAKIADLTRTRIQIQLSQGYAYYSVFKGNEADVEIDTPNVAVRPVKPGRYRIQVNSDNETEVVVRDGAAEIDTPQGSTTVKKDNSIIIRGTADNAEYKVADAPHADDWDHWNKDRDNAIKDAQAWQHTNGYYTGASDLDAHGRWIYIPGYGNVWQPYQDAAWAPYQDGRWVWEPYWGWTWVSYEPWGWAPYHYGRWFFWNSSWVWWPGPVRPFYRPLWAPAFVTFIGFGHHSSFAFGFGSIGWIPVGPFDPCFPWWGRGFGRVDVVNINIFNGGFRDRDRFFIRPLGVRGRERFISNIDMARRDPRVRRGISGVDVDHFGRGDMRVRRLDVRDADFRDSRVMTGNLPVVPTRASLHAGAATRPAFVARSNGRFFTHRQPPAALPGFQNQRQRVQQVVERHGANGEIPGARNAGFGGRAAQGDNHGEFHSQPGVANRPGSGPVANGAQNGNRNRGDWHSFGRSGNDRNASEHAGSGNAEGAATRPAMAQRNDSPRNGRPGTNDHNVPSSVDGAAHFPRGGASGAQPSGDRGNQGGWTKFGSPAGGRSTDTGDRGGRAGQQGNFPHNSGPASRSGEQNGGDRGGFQRFPSGGDRPSAQPERQQPSGNRGGGWERFPSGGRQNADQGPGARDGGSRDEGSRGGNDRSGRPPLELNKPIVTPRPPETRSGGGFGGYNRGGGYDRGAGRSGGGYNPGSAGRPSGGGYSRGASRGGGGGSFNRGSAGRSGGGGGNHGGGGGHSSGHRR